MSKDIITNIIVKKENKIKKINIIQKQKIINNSLNNSNFQLNINNGQNIKNIKSINKLNLNINANEKVNNNLNINNLNKQSNKNKKLILPEQNKINYILKQLSYCDSFKIIFCMNNKNIKLTRELKKIFNQDICIDQILKRIYK